MRLPPLLLACAILVWGWQTGDWSPAAIAVLACLSPRLIRRRWDIGEEQLRRVADFCAVLVLAAAAILYAVYGNPRAVKLWFQWLPVMLAPLPLVMYYAGLDKVEAAVLFWSLRRVRERRPSFITLDYPWFALWLIGASAANTRGIGFYIALSLLAAGSLWTIRPRGGSISAWAAIIALAAALGAGLHTGLHTAQIWLEAQVTDWIAGSGSRTDPYRSRTDIGTRGELKLSPRILMRIEGAREPLKLHRASYNELIGPTWVARDAAFNPIPLSAPGVWQLAEPSGENARSRTLRIADRSERGNPVLALPFGAQRLEGLPAAEVKRTPLGTVQAEVRPGDFRFSVIYASGGTLESAPTDADLRLPRAERAAVQALADQLAPAGTPPREAVRNIVRHFAENFRYATWQAAPEGSPGAIARSHNLSALARFLNATRAGHCEYFASAAVLVARAAGIPARYATGFSAHEWSEREQAFIVRERHAHAWARIWVTSGMNGNWEDLDTTPPGWAQEEAAGDGAWTWLADWASFLRYRITRLFADVEPGTGTVLLTLPILAWILLRQLRGSRKTQPSGAAARASPPGADSPFYRLEARIAALGHARVQGESLKDWLQRLPAALPVDRHAAARALELHYRYRFDPAGLTAGEIAALEAASLASVTATRH